MSLNDLFPFCDTSFDILCFLITCYVGIQGDTPLDMSVAKKTSWIVSKIKAARVDRGLDGSSKLKRMVNSKVSISSDNRQVSTPNLPYTNSGRTNVLCAAWFLEKVLLRSSTTRLPSDGSGWQFTVPVLHKRSTKRPLKECVLSLSSLFYAGVVEIIQGRIQGMPQSWL